MLTRPRLSGLTVAPDGSLLVVGVATPAPDGARYRTALWSVDPAGSAAPRQLTRSAAGESAAAFLPGGDLLFTSARPDPDAAPDSPEPPAALWRLPRSGGEAELLLAPSAGIRGVWTAAEADVVVVAAEVHLAASTLEDDAAREQARRDAHVTARLYEPDEYPVRFWDRWLGPREPALWVLDLGAEADAEVADAVEGGVDAEREGAADAERDADPGGRVRLLARGAGLRDTGVALSPDGSTVVTTWARTGPRRSPDDLVTDLVAIDVASGQRRVLADDGRSYGAPSVSPDGSEVVCIAADQGAPDRTPDHTLVLVPLPDAETERLAKPRDLTPGWDRWPDAPTWTADGGAVLCTADDHGHAPVFRVDTVSREVVRLTTDGAYQDLAVPASGSGGRAGFALRSTVATAPHPVALDLDAQEQQPVALPSPGGDDPADTRVERITTTAPDGAEVGSWLVLPVARGKQADTGGRSGAEVADAPGEAATTSSEPLPLVVLLHGGPLGSWNAWHWRWNPHVWAAEGYAVLLPDPALSTGYGRAWIERGWGRWGQAPYTDVMAAVEHVAARPDIDADRVAAGGGSFGGYLANWIAGQTDRFRAIITHASLWSLPGFHGTTDLGLFWEREFGDPYLDPARYLDSSPHLHVGRITTPMLVIHGELDVRVPISEGVTLWTDLVRHGVAARFLYFPDEHHWVLKPQHARLWYETVLAFLDEHLRELPFERPALL
ncbi:MAG: S9 family peptidase [Nitriliruptor sp.]|nr:MAG: S9 family peptidase [Nitriliruptor sp.]